VMSEEVDDPESTDIAETAEDAGAKLLQGLFKSCGITKVICIDDMADPESRSAEDEMELFLTRVSSGSYSMDELKAAPFVRDRMTELGEQGTEGDMRQALEEDLRANPPSEADSSQLSEYFDDSTDYMELFRRHLEPSVECAQISPGDWRKDRDTYVGGSGLLILFDIFFNGAREGDQLAVDLAGELVRDNREDIWTGVLSHKGEDPVAEWQKIVNAGGGDGEGPLPDQVALRVLWMSKGVLGDAKELFEAMCIILTSPALCMILESSAKHLRSEVENVIKQTESLNKLDLYRAMLHSQSQDDRFEPAILIRLWVGQAGKLATLRGSDDIDQQDIMKAVRAVSASVQALDTAPRHDVAQIERHQYYHSYEELMARCLPLEPGDIFALVSDASLAERAAGGDNSAWQEVVRGIPEAKQFVLLAQGCDLSIRTDGVRRIKTRLLTAARIKMVDEVGGHPGLGFPAGQRDSEAATRWFCLPLLGEMDDGMSDAFVDLRARMEFPIEALDACVFNEFGIASIGEKDPTPKTSTPNLAKYHSKLKAKIKSYRSLLDPVKADRRSDLLTALAWGVVNVASADRTAQMNAESDRITWGLIRVARVTEPYRSALVTAAALDEARPAFDALVGIPEGLRNRGQLTRDNA
jgi:hypothetical protein